VPFGLAPPWKYPPDVAVYLKGQPQLDIISRYRILSAPNGVSTATGKTDCDRWRFDVPAVLEDVNQAFSRYPDEPLDGVARTFVEYAQTLYRNAARAILARQPLE